MTKAVTVAIATFGFLLVVHSAQPHAQRPAVAGRVSTFGVRPLNDASRIPVPDFRDVQILATSLFQSVEPNRAENAHYPDFVRNNIAWLYSQLNRKTVTGPYLTLEPYFPNRNNQLLSVGVENDSKFIQLHAGRLWHWVRVEEQMETGFTKTQKDSFALFLTHEAIHLQSDNLNLSGNVDEELRAHYLVAVNATRHLRAAGITLHKDLVTDDEIFKACGYEPDCPTAKKLISERLALVR
jgi:hypothetical protein